MKGKWRRYIGITSILGMAILMLSLSNCARSTQLTGITIQPGGGTFGAADPSLFFQFKAIGSYIHPPKTVDITSQVSWQTDNPQVIQVTTAGIASPTLGCGVAQVFAEMHDHGSDILSNSATITVDGPASLGCTPPGAQPILTVNASGTGTVVSSPAGINCSSPSSCNATFTTGQTVTLTGTPTGTSTSVTWNGCSSASGTTCTVLMENNVTVTATFQ